MNKETLTPKQTAQQKTGVRTRQTLFKEREKFQMIQVDTTPGRCKHQKQTDEVARRKVRVAIKVKEQKHRTKTKTTNGKILIFTPHTAWVQTLGKQPAK